MPDRAEDYLGQVGFTGLEAAIYLTLLKESGLTGYRISKLAGKPVSNVYKALDSLESKGAIISDGSGKSRLYSALPIGVYLDHREQEFASSRKVLEQSLKDVATPSVDYGVFKLDKVEQIFERAESMLERAEQNILVDCLPAPPKQIVRKLEKLAASGIKIIIQGTGDFKVKGCQVFSTHDGEEQTQFPGTWFSIVVDASEYLVAFMSSDYSKVYEAFWSRSPFLTLLMFNGLFHEFANRQTWLLLKKKAPVGEIHKLHKEISKTFTLIGPAVRKLYSIHGIDCSDIHLDHEALQEKPKRKKSKS